MKKHIFVLLIFSYLFSSCCGKKDCEASFYGGITLVGFSSKEVENIQIKTYEKGSDFNNVIDSCDTSAKKYNDIFIVYFPCVEVELSFEYDYKVVFINTDLKYEITEMKSKTIGCNECFLGTYETDYFDVLHSYKVNGKYILNKDLELKK